MMEVDPEYTQEGYAKEEGQGQAQAPSEPNNTLYLKNLNERVPKSGDPKSNTQRKFFPVFVLVTNSVFLSQELKQALYLIFSEYGPILDVVAMKTQKLRGQAFVVFVHLTSAISALQALQGHQLFDKNMVGFSSSCPLSSFLRTFFLSFYFCSVFRFCFV